MVCAQNCTTSGRARTPHTLCTGSTTPKLPPLLAPTQTPLDPGLPRHPAPALTSLHTPLPHQSSSFLTSTSGSPHPAPQTPPCLGTLTSSPSYIWLSLLQVPFPHTGLLLGALLLAVQDPCFPQPPPRPTLPWAPARLCPLHCRLLSSSSSLE